jgi:membrane protein involved in colicin uptake
VAALVVPAATATPGNGNGGNGGGKPSSAGASSDHGGKPSWAGQGQAKAEKAAARAEKAAAKAAAKAARAQAKADRAEARSAAGAARTSGKPDLSNLDELTAEDLEGLNPAWTCKVERALSGDSFAEDHGTNENDANAFGMCVSDEGSEEQDSILAMLRSLF